MKFQIAGWLLTLTGIYILVGGSKSFSKQWQDVLEFFKNRKESNPQSAVVEEAKPEVVTAVDETQTEEVIKDQIEPTVLSEPELEPEPEPEPEPETEQAKESETVVKEDENKE